MSVCANSCIFPLRLSLKSSGPFRVFTGTSSGPFLLLTGTSLDGCGTNFCEERKEISWVRDRALHGAFIITETETHTLITAPMATSVQYEHHTSLGESLGLSFYATFILRKETWVTCHISAQYNKNGFQQDAYRPLQWPSRGKGVCPGTGGGGLPRGVCPGVYTFLAPCGQNDKRLWKYNLSATTVADDN